MNEGDSTNTQYIDIGPILNQSVETVGGNIKNPSVCIGINPKIDGEGIGIDYINQFAKMKVYKVTISPFVNHP